MYFYSYCCPGLETICCGFRVLEQVGEICLYRAICMKEGDGAGRSIDDRKREKQGEREINRYGVRRIDSLWTEGDSGRELMVGTTREEDRV